MNIWQRFWMGYPITIGGLSIGLSFHGLPATHHWTPKWQRTLS